MKKRPTFIDSPYFVPELDNWHLTDDAPEELKKEFDEFMKEKDIVHQDEEGD